MLIAQSLSEGEAAALVCRLRLQYSLLCEAEPTLP